MPNTIAHLLFAEKVRRELPEARREFLDRYPDAYRSGAFGPDFMYVLRQLGMKGGRLANRLHRERVRAVFEALSAASGKDAALVFAYGAGLMTHYVLDRTAHPLVCALSERYLPKFFPPEYQNNLHNLIETEADEFALRDAGLDPRGFDAARYGKARRKTKRALGMFYEKRLFPLLCEGVSARKVAFCFTVWNALGKMWRDPDGARRRRIARLERNKEGRPLTALLRPTENPNGADLLNLEKRPYPVPRGGAACGDRSFPELYSASVGDAVVYLDAYFRAKDNPDALRALDFSVDYEGIAVAFTPKA